MGGAKKIVGNDTSRRETTKLLLVRPEWPVCGTMAVGTERVALFL